MGLLARALETDPGPRQRNRGSLNGPPEDEVAAAYKESMKATVKEGLFPRSCAQSHTVYFAQWRQQHFVVACRSSNRRAMTEHRTLGHLITHARPPSDNPIHLITALADSLTTRHVAGRDADVQIHRILAQCSHLGRRDPPPVELAR